MSDARERREEMIRWYGKIAAAYEIMSEADRQELHEWERTHLDGRYIGTSDWPGWERLIGKPPDLGAGVRLNFREERLRRISDGDTPVELDHAPLIVLHVLPCKFQEEFDLPGAVDVNTLMRNLAPVISKNASPLAFQHEPNAEGYIAYAPKTEPAYTYAQLFRDGKVEIVRASYYREGLRVINREYEVEILDALARALTLHEALGIEPPVSVMLSLLDVSGCSVGTDQQLIQGTHPIKQDNLVPREILVTSFEPRTQEHLAQLMRATFNQVWNAAGWPKSMNYDEDGKWLGR